MAVKLSVPVAREVVDSVATPEELRVPVPSSVEPLRKLTVPVGGALPLPVTVAFKVNAAPEVIELSYATRLVVVDCGVPVAATTVTDTTAEVLDWKLVLPVYWAVRLLVPAARDDVDSVATPDEFRVAVPSNVEPFRKLTEPPGTVLSLPSTVAVRTRTWPAVIGFEEAARLVVVVEST